MALFHHFLQAVRHGIYLDRQIPKLRNLRFIQSCIQRPLRKLCGNILQPVDGLLYKYRSILHPPGPEEPGQDHDDGLRCSRKEDQQPECIASSGRCLDLPGDIIIQHAVDQIRHVPDFIHDGLIFHHGTSGIDIVTDLIHIFLQSLHGTVGYHQQHPALIIRLLHDLLQGIMDTEDRCIYLAFGYGLPAADDTPDGFRDLLGNDHFQTRDGLHAVDGTVITSGIKEHESKADKDREYQQDHQFLAHAVDLADDAFFLSDPYHKTLRISPARHAMDRGQYPLGSRFERSCSSLK